MAALLLYRLGDATAATLPVPCLTCAGGFVSAGQATAVQAGSKLTVTQASNAATLNWQSFNISADGAVQFVQPSATAVALNQIFDANASQILGALSANGRIFLINQNGIIFGGGAQVNVGGLVASTLAINPTAVSGGLIAAGSNGQPAFEPFSSGSSGAVTIQPGATLLTSQGGQILVFAPQITNQGSISTPGGQTMLAAGNDIYLASSADPNLRGLLVEVSGPGTVTNGSSANGTVTTPSQLLGQISAADGNVTLAAMAVNQQGRISASTSINENGSIYLQAGQGSITQSGATGVSGTLQAGTGGQLLLGAQSDTEVTLDSTDASTTVDSVPQLKSTIDLSGDNIQMQSGALARATSGVINVAAAQNASEPDSAQSDGSRFYMAPGAELDVSGASITLPVSSNVIAVQLRGTELADSPLQQNGPLRGQTVYVDIRQGTPLADISGEIAAIGYNVVERNLAGGSINLDSRGDVILAPDSTLDVAGGQTVYTGGYLNTTNLVTTAGQIVNIADADPNVLYAGIANTTTVADSKWGTSSSYTVTPGSYSPGYVQGADAGTLSISAPQFVFDSAVNAATVAGLYQRDPDTAVAAGSLYRPYDQLPDPATLIIGSPGAAGSDFAVADVTLAPQLVLPTLVNADGSAFDPLTDALPASYTSSVLRPQLLGSQGFGNVEIYANGNITIPLGSDVTLPAGGSFAAYAADIDIEASITAHGGNITASSESTFNGQPSGPFGLTIGPQAQLITSGEWINDSPLLYPTGNSAPLFINGGSVSLAASSSTQSYSPGLQLEAGSLIDVSGGAYVNSTGGLTAGSGGSISIVSATNGALAAPSDAPRLALDGSLRGYALYQGGSLSLSDASVCIAVSDCSGGDLSTLWVSPAQLSAGGFGSYALTATQGGLTVAPGTQITLQQQNLALPSGYSLLPDAVSLEPLSRVQTLSEQIREPVNLSLTQSYLANSQNDSNVVPILDVGGGLPSLVIGQGAVIQADPGAAVSLSSNVRILDSGSLESPGGSISLALTAGLPENQYDPTQAIWLGPDATIDAAGTAQIYPNTLGEPVGTVLDGGSVTLTAQRGFIELLPGSLIDVAGTQALVDEIGPSGGAPRLEQVGSAGGSVTLSAAEGIVLAGSLQAQAGISGAGANQPAGGSFSLALDGSARNDYALGNGGVSTFPAQAREILVSQTQPPIVVAPGTAVPDYLAGLAYVSASQLQSAGFDSVSLRAAPLQASSGSVVPGLINFVGDVSLSAGEQITLDAPTYAVSPGAVAQINAPYVQLGNSDQQYLSQYPASLAATPGTGTLAVSAGFIQLYGTSWLQGVGTAQFDSSGDLRLLGLLDLSSASATTLNGALYAAGTVDLTAQQVYPTTLSQFLISTDPSSVSDPTAGSINIQGEPGTNTQLLSAGGALTLSAGAIVQDGVLRAPFGQITLDAQSITLGAGSLTSTSADGLTIPFGNTQGAGTGEAPLGWIYPLQNGNDIVYGTGGLAPPAQQVTLQGAQVSVNSGAVIDVSGGGDLQASEWIDGTGGTNDVLSPSVRPDQYAILPGLQANVAPYDTEISAGSTLQVGQSVYLSGMPGLPAGVYQLLPARYALLPGAYLVTPVAGYQDLQPGQAVNVLGGGTIIAGYNTVAGTSFADARSSGFDVVPASIVLQQAQYVTTSANQFFPSQASAAGTAAPRVPNDSGVLALIASNALSLDGTLQTAPADGGLGAQVDISSANILVAPASAAAAAQPGQIVLTSDSLTALGAQTLLLGGLSSNGVIDTTAQDVQIGAGASLSAPLLLISAQNQISVDAGAALGASGTAPGAQSFQLSGDGAFLSVGAGSQDTVTRSGATGATGILDLAAGSSLSAPGGAIFLEATNNVVTDGALSLLGGALAVQSPTILLGAAPAGASGTVLGANILGVQGLKTLSLQSSSDIQVYGTVSASAQDLTLDTPGLQGYGLASDVATLSATDAITLENSQGAASVGGGTGAGSLALDAATVQFGGGNIAIGGFDALAMNASQALTASASGALNVAGALNVTAPLITTASNVTLGLTAAGAVSLAAPSQAASTASPSALGGTLEVTGASVQLATTLALPSGAVSLTATSGDVSVQAGGSVDVAGVVQTYDGVSVPTPGGALTLSAAGNINLAAGSTLDVSAGSAGQGGSLRLSAPGGTVSVAGTLQGQGGPGLGASFDIDAQQFGDFAALNQMLDAGGFAGSRSVRLRGPGDLTIAAGTDNAVTASTISLETDQGNIVVNGLIDASGGSGGSVTLAASGNVIVNGMIEADGTAAGQNGGTIALETSGGDLQLTGGSTLDVSGAATGGTVLLRVPAATVAAVTGGGTGVAMNGSITGSSSTVLEAYATYLNTTGTISATDETADSSNPIYAAAANLMANSAAITAALGQSGNAGFVLEPGVEIDATAASNGTGTLALDTPWNLYDWRFGASNVPGVLTLRAQNGITFNASLSDGFAATSGTGAFTLPAQASSSWSYRITAGADLSAANPLTVDAANPADVTIAACASNCAVTSTPQSTTLNLDYAPNMVRTGTGFIDVSASGDFVLGNQQSLLYTAGVADPSGIHLGRVGAAGSLQGLAYPTGGGNIQIDVAGDVVGAPSNQFVNDWLWRVGGTANNPTSSSTAWTVDFAGFQQGIAALGGGNVAVQAGGDITDLSASIPSIGLQVGGTTLATNDVQVINSGTLDVQAGGSILGGTFYVGAGNATLQAGGQVGASASTGLSPVIGLGDASVAITGRGDVQVADILNPTLLDRGALQGSGSGNVYFSTYGADSSVDLISVGGNVTLNDDTNALLEQFSSSFVGGQTLTDENALGPLDTLPPILNVYAPSGDIDIGRVLALSPSGNGNLNLFAGQNIVATASNGTAPEIIVSDADPTLLPSPQAPSGNVNIYDDITDAFVAPLPDQHAAVPVYQAADQAGTLQPARLVALNGSITFDPNYGGEPEGVWSAKPVDVIAGQNIVNLNLVAQNLGAADVTQVSAGGSILYPEVRLSNGTIAQDLSGIAVDGPGELQLAAGDNISLGTSSGVVTRANLVNPVLPATGASVSVEAGLGGGAPQYAAFISQYIDNSSEFDDELISYVQDIEGSSGLSATRAKQDFNAMGLPLQRTFVEQLFLDLLRLYGSQEAASGNGDFAGAFAAIQTLFPGANPDLAQDQSNPYSGNIDLYFSRIYTEQGGNISLLAPGGQINVGLALAPSSFGLNKQPDQLGIVAQTTGNVSAFSYGDFEVNQSRVFAADGGDILVWSTEGNIDAGRGAKTSISAPSLSIAYDDNGDPTVTLRSAIAGSGIQALAASPGVSPGNVYLFAPHGVVNANDAGIVAGNLTIAATAVLGTSNITVSGTSVGVPVAVTGVGAAFAGASSTAGAASNASDTADQAAAAASAASNTPAADAALSFLDVFVTGLGEANCAPNDTACLQREIANPAAN